MKKTTLFMVGMICMICLVLVPAVSAADQIPFNRSAAKVGDAFYSGSTIVTTPAGATFSKPVTVSFTLTPDQWKQALEVTNGNAASIVIASFNSSTQSWVRESQTTLTTGTDGSHVVSGTTTHTGIFSVFYIVEPLSGASSASPTPQTFGQMATPAGGGVQTPAAAATPVGTPVKAPVSTKPTQSPMLPGIAVIGLVGLVGYLIVRKKE
ncbi:MAG: hypothetical protein WC586_13585 [Methanoregula sp.]